MHIGNPVTSEIQSLDAITEIKRLALDDLVVGEVKAVERLSNSCQGIFVEGENRGLWKFLLVQGELFELRAVLQTLQFTDHVLLKVELLEIDK